MSQLRFLFSLTVISVLALSLTGHVWAKTSANLIHEAEYSILLKQHGEKWAAEDREIDARLETLRKKHGKRPNIIYIMWDDMKYGAIGHEMFNKVTGYTSPNINKLAAEGMSFTRMYSEPSCTPTRVAAMTGRQPVRSGMIFPIFPVHQMGLSASVQEHCWVSHAIGKFACSLVLPSQPPATSASATSATPKGRISRRRVIGAHPRAGCR